jgi:Double zinc ribbon
MQCPKCKSGNSDAAQFCTRCHTTLRFICPACRHSQDHGATCDQCGVDFAKYAAMLIVKEQVEAENQHTRVRERAGLWKQVFLLPITGGFSLLKYFFGPRNT